MWFGKKYRKTTSYGFTNTLLFLLIVLLLKDNNPNSTLSVSNNYTIFSIVLHTATNIFFSKTII